MSVLIKGLKLVLRTLGPVFPGITTRMAHKLFFTNWRFKKPRIEQKIASMAKARVVDVNGVPIRLWQWGEGEPKILFIHGWSGRGTQIASFVKPLVEQGFCVLSFDAPAHGESGGKRTDVFKIVESLSVVLDQIGPLHGVITHSLGATILSQLLTEELILKKIVLLCPPTSLDVILKNFQHQLDLPSEIIARLRRLLVKEFGAEMEERLLLSNKTWRFNCPVLIIHDEHDEGVNWHASEELAMKMPEAEFYKTQGLGHVKILYAQSVISKVSSFFSV